MFMFAGYTLKILPFRRSCFENVTLSVHSCPTYHSWCQRHDADDGSDDDVVARQLREAAENETDPELRKRLWEEYRHYKQGR